MRRTRALLAVALPLLLIGAQTQPTKAQLAPGGVGVFWDRAGTQTTIDIRGLGAGTSFYAYIVADIPEGGCKGFWFGSDFSAPLDVQGVTPGEPQLLTQWGTGACDPPVSFHWFGDSPSQTCLPPGRHVLAVIELDLGLPGSNYHDLYICPFSGQCGTQYFQPAFYRPCEGGQQPFASVGACATINSGTSFSADPTRSTATAGAASTLLVCPAADGPSLASIGAPVQVEIQSFGGTPVAGVPASDIWLVSVTASALPFCAPGLSADHDTDANGQTTISGTPAAGGCNQDGLRVMLAGQPITGSPPLPISVNSPDLTGDLRVNLGDVSGFSAALNGAYSFCADFYRDNLINLVDVSIMSQHLGHLCQ